LHYMHLEASFSLYNTLRWISRFDKPAGYKYKSRNRDKTTICMCDDDFERSWTNDGFYDCHGPLSCHNSHSTHKIIILTFLLFSFHSLACQTGGKGIGYRKYWKCKYVCNGEKEDTKNHQSRKKAIFTGWKRRKKKRMRYSKRRCKY